MGIQHREVVSVIAGGWSVTEVDLLALPGHVIGVNDSAYYAPVVHSIISMDRLWTLHRHDWLMQMQYPTYLRSGTVRNEELCTQPWVTQYTCDYKSAAFGPTAQRMNGTNSAGVALNLAYVMRPDLLYLFGFDMCRGPHDEAHWYPDYPWNPKATKQGKLAAWGREYSVIADAFRAIGTNVLNVSERSRITEFKKVRPQDVGMRRTA